MRALQLFIKLTLYYSALGVVAGLINHFIPSVMEQLTGDPSVLEGGRTTATDIFNGKTPATKAIGDNGRAFYVATATISALLIMLPVRWVYLAIRRRKDLDQALVETMFILPIAVTGIVFIVQNSLALAFSLAGIVAGVRFRHTLKSPADTLFIFIAIGVGLAAGVKAISIALTMTVIFNYTFLILWMGDFNKVTKKGKKYMRNSHEKEEKNKTKDVETIEDK
jgi:hypothetical protein